MNDIEEEVARYVGEMSFLYWLVAGLFFTRWVIERVNNFINWLGHRLGW